MPPSQDAPYGNQPPQQNMYQGGAPPQYPQTQPMPGQPYNAPPYGGYPAGTVYPVSEFILINFTLVSYVKLIPDNYLFRPNKIVHGNLGSVWGFFRALISFCFEWIFFPM